MIRNDKTLLGGCLLLVVAMCACEVLEAQTGHKPATRKTKSRG